MSSRNKVEPEQKSDSLVALPVPEAVKDLAATLTKQSAKQVQTLKNKEQNPGEAVTEADIAEWQSQLYSDPSKRVIGTLLSKTDLFNGLLDTNSKIAHADIFNTKISQDVGPISNQSASGRCWLFATLNAARVAFAKKYNVSDHQFSAANFFFWSRMEKANTYLESMIKLAEEPLDAKAVECFNDWVTSDGGTWHESASIVAKYGLVPQALHPESYSTRNSHSLGVILGSKLREFSLELRGIYNNARDSNLKSQYGANEAWRKAAVSACRERKRRQLYQIYSILALVLGKPPALGQKLKFEYYDKDKKFQSFEKTAVEIYESLAPEFVVEDWIMLSHDPNLPIDRAVVNENSLFNIMGYKPTRFINVDVDRMELMVVSMIKADRPVWFACQVETFSDSASGVMDTKLYDLMAALGTGLNMTKQQRLLTRDAWPTHAMAIVGVHLDAEGKAVRYRVENSWSAHSGKKGYFIMSSDRFKAHTYEVVISRDLLPAEIVDVFDNSVAIKVPPFWAVGGGIKSHKL